MIRPIALTVVLLFGVAAAHAAESSAVSSSRTVATIITDTDTVQSGQIVHAGLRLRLAPGWHTYWHNPGDAGIPPALDISPEPSQSASSLEWPLPQRVAEGTLTTYAYTGDLVLPFTLTPGQGDLSLKAHAEWLACRDICVPEEADFTLTVPSGPPAPSHQAPLMEGALARVPRPAMFSASVTRSGTLSLGGGSLPGGITRAEFFPSAPGLVQRATAHILSVDPGTLTLQIDPLGQPVPSDLSGVVALTTAAGVTSAFVISPDLVVAAATAPFIAPLLLLALGGGLLLNLMPCVFPVLAMKAVALTRLSGVCERRMRAEALSYSVGVVGSFVALGAIFIALRAAGQVAGWGFQFQSPSFVTATAWLLFAIGLEPVRRGHGGRRAHGAG